MTEYYDGYSALEEYSTACHANSVNKGFYNEYDVSVFKDAAAKIALIHSEGTELLEALRKQRGSAETESEVADIFIRTFDLWAALKEVGLVTGTLDDAVKDKMQKNAGRPFMHGVLG
jgi:NTP pyrophosphatase (non-canonical NTP hydrolase)